MNSETPLQGVWYNQSLVIWKFHSRTSRRQVSWLAGIPERRRLPDCSVAAFPHYDVLPAYSDEIAQA